jgi:hypothetical protein
VPDGPLIGPRWLLHLIKLAQHAGPAFGLLCLTRNIYWPCVVCGPIAYAIVSFRKLYVAHRDHWHVSLADLVHDAAFPLAIVAGARIYERSWLVGLTELGIAIALWIVLHSKAIP